jgi:acetaldehyde dehydrogenase (acetylating)
MALDQVDGPLGREKLAPLLSLFTVDGTSHGLEVCQRLLANQGAGHTAVIHTGDQALQQRFAEAVPASRVLVNRPATHGCIGTSSGWPARSSAAGRRYRLARSLHPILARA